MSFFTCFWLFPQNEHFSRSPPSPNFATSAHLVPCDVAARLGRLHVHGRARCSAGYPPRGRSPLHAPVPYGRFAVVSRELGHRSSPILLSEPPAPRGNQPVPSADGTAASSRLEMTSSTMPYSFASCPLMMKSRS